MSRKEKEKVKQRKGNNHRQYQMKKNIFVWCALVHILKVGLAKNGLNAKESVTFGPM